MSMKKIYKYVLMLILPIALVSIVIHYCKNRHAIPFTYDAKNVDKLHKLSAESPYEKEHGIVLKKVDDLEDDLVAVYNFTGENGIGWNNDPGDFCRIKIKLPNGKIDSYDSGEWLNIFKQIEDCIYRPIAETLVYPKESTKVKLRPYGITLDLQNGDKILILISYGYSSDPSALFTLIYIGQKTSEVIFNKHFDLYEIREEVGGYELLGVESVYGGCCEPYKITIKDNQLTYGEYELATVYEGKEDPRIILYNGIGYKRDRKEGEFTRIELPDLQDDVSSEKIVPKQFFDVFPRQTIWTPVPAGIKLDQTQTVTITPYYLVLNQPTGKVMLFFSDGEEEIPPPVLYTAKIVPFDPYHKSRCCFSLQEIVEDEEAYHLLGFLPNPYPYTREEENDPTKIYEITIDKATMSREVSWLKSSK
jgi:hypothetical protein